MIKSVINVFKILPPSVRYGFRLPQQCHKTLSNTKYYKVLQSITMYYKVLQSITKYYKVLQSITKCYKVLQCITKRYSLGSLSSVLHAHNSVIFIVIETNLRPLVLG